MGFQKLKALFNRSRNDWNENEYGMALQVNELLIPWLAGKKGYLELGWYNFELCTTGKTELS